MQTRIFNHCIKTKLAALHHGTGLKQLSLSACLGLAVALSVSAKNPGEQGRDTFPNYIPFDGTQLEFLEGVAVDKVGNVYVSLRASPFGPLPLSDQIWRISPSGEKSKLADFGVPGGGGCGLAVDPEGNVYMARNIMPGNGVYRVDRDGNFALLPGTDQIVFPDGLVFDQRGNLYITESYSLREPTAATGPFGQGGIWRIPKGGTVELWLRHELLTGVYPPLLFAFPVGANGIGFYHSTLYVNNTDKALVARIPVQPDGSPGEPEVWAEVKAVPGSLFEPSAFPVMLDGIALDVHGNVYAAVPSRAAVIRINAADLSQETIAAFPDYPLDAPLSLTFGTGKGDKTSLFVTSGGYTGFLVPGIPWPGPALVKIPAGVPGLPLP